MTTENEQGLKLSGFFEGKVLKHCDFGKCKIWIPGVYQDELAEQPDNLPDAIQVASIFGGSLKGSGVFSYPNVGSIVICGFLNEDQNLPFYFGVLQGGEEAKKQYNDVKTVNTDEALKAGDDARIHKIRVDNATIKIWESGHIEIKTFTDRMYATSNTENPAENPKEGCKIDITENGAVTIHASSQININAPNIKIESGVFELDSESITVTASDITIKDDTMNITTNNMMDVYAKTENHMNGAHTVTAMDRINQSANFVKMQGARHPAIFL